MNFIKNGLDTSTIDDPVFAISKLAKEDPDASVINATIGSLYDEEGHIVTYDTFYNILNSLDDAYKASYAQSFRGNDDYLKAVISHVLDNRVKLPTKALATSGGTGAISLVIKDFLSPKDTILMPNIAWASYSLMAKEYDLNIKTYDPLNTDDILAKVDEVIENQEKLVLIINSPCHNPLGSSLSYDEWERIINKLNSLDKPAILLNDIAYFDYVFDPKAKDYYDLFNKINSNVLVTIAFSLSKTMTAYGIRCGALILIHQDEDKLTGISNALARSCRCLWSNINNGAMIAFAKVYTEKYTDFIKEKAEYIDLLSQRAKLFIKEANDINLEYYPYKEGFFITLKCPDNKYRDLLHQKLIQRHIYTVKVNLGIRLAICSIPLNKISGLAKRIKEVSDSIESCN